MYPSDLRDHGRNPRFLSFVFLTTTFTQLIFSIRKFTVHKRTFQLGRVPTFGGREEEKVKFTNHQSLVLQFIEMSLS